MSDPGRIPERYRELAVEAPPAALDAAILAASRRAVGARPGRAQRWFAPVSVAAVLVLGIGVALRMQVEQPGVETSLPQAEYPVPSSAAPEPPPAMAPGTATTESSAAGAAQAGAAPTAPIAEKPAAAATIAAPEAPRPAPRASRAAKEAEQRQASPRAPSADVAASRAGTPLSIDTAAGNAAPAARGFAPDP